MRGSSALEVDLAGTRLVTTRIVGDLYVSYGRQQAFDGAHQVALHDLHVVDVVLQLQVCATRIGNALQRQRRAIEQVPGHIPRVLMGSIIAVASMAASLSAARAMLVTN